MIYSINDTIHFPEIDQVISADHAMHIAIQVANQGAAFVGRNPMVGCVIVDEQHRFLAAGFHEKYGEAHAEVNALKNISDQDRLKDATFYVTLEPCAHEGKTPSCAKALAKLPISKVVYGLQDPNPLVCGQGAQILKAAGIEAVEYLGELKSELKQLPEIFLKNITQKKIFVAAKVATSLDGQIALANGESKWITGSESREFSHELRSRYDAVLVGKNTILNDDPVLNIRHPKIQKTNKVVILDRSQTIQKQIKEGRDFHFLKSHTPENIIFPKSIALPDVLLELWSLGLRSVFIEGGAEIHSAFFKENLVDRIHLFMAPVILGAAGGQSWTKNLAISSMSQKIYVDLTEHRSFGRDLYYTGRFIS